LRARLGGPAAPVAARPASDLRQAGFRAVLAQPGRSLRGQMRHASALGARYTLVLGDAEVAAGTVQVKAMDSGEQRETPLTEAALLIRGA
ncbi:MAG: His/Gly/Thr/Pro-type tRNA ligase C-terminal domain-containing protein, partial [Chloroflexi bacterium]|nr:His/Gly/Thr/Pro-type tRNA ligase C-terminal domain-containing protein [Chloroflexota bacterium]